LFLESFRAADIGALGGKYGVSPNFDRLSRQGILFPRFYANGIQTTRGVLAALYGVLPRFSHRSVQSGEPDIQLIGLPTLFKRRGYRTAFIHNGPLAFEGQDQFLTHHAFDEVHGEERILQKFPSAEGTSWGPFDEYLMPYAVEWLLRMDRMGTPTFLTMLTMTNHHPWTTPSGFNPPRIENDDAEHARFLSSFSYTDKCLGSFWEMLEKNGLDQRTLVFVLADTSQPMGEHNLNYFLHNHMYEENLRIPLLILAEGRIAESKSIDHIGSQVDLLPTIMDIFGMKGLNHAMGTSLMRRVQDRSVFFNNPYLHGYWGLRKNNHKYIYGVDTARAFLYDLSTDPGEIHNRTDAMPELSAEYHDLVFGTHRLFERLYNDRLFTKPSRN
ncbi:LTA synthase family protein, partial [Thermodesulfobacteriota bacterium]